MPAVKITSTTSVTSSHSLSHPQLELVRDEGHVSTFATRAEGGGGISVGAVVGIIIAVVLVLGLVLGIYLRNRNRTSPITARAQIQHPQPIYYPQAQAQKKSFFALSPPIGQAHPQYLPTYVTPSTTSASAYGQQNYGGVTMPQAVHPSTGGYYARATPGRGGDRVRFGRVGVVEYETEAP